MSIEDVVAALPPWIQALTAVLTVVLLYLVYRSAEAGDREIRIDRQLAVMPFLTASISTRPHEDGNVGVDIQVTNLSNHPALNVYVLFDPGGDRTAMPDPQRGSSAAQRYPAFEAGGQRTFGHILSAKQLSAELLLRVVWSGSIGGTSWTAHGLIDTDTPNPGWTYLGRCTQPSIRGSQRICD